MGLDVYLYEAETPIRRDKYGDIVTVSSCNVRSRKHPQYAWTGPRCLRSSYTEVGFDQAVPQLTGCESATLYWIFEPILGTDPRIQTVIGPDLILALIECTRRVDEIRELLHNSDGLMVKTVSGGEISTSEAALAWARARKARQVVPGLDVSGWSTRAGYAAVAGAELDVVAIVPAKVYSGIPETYVVIQSPHVGGYIDETDIIAEFIEDIGRHRQGRQRRCGDVVVMTDPRNITRNLVEFCRIAGFPNSAAAVGAPPDTWEVLIRDIETELGFHGLSVDARKTSSAIATTGLRIVLTLLQKNRRYGNSVFDPVQIFAPGSSPEALIRVRLDDKLARIRAGAADEDEDPIIDIIGYLLLLLVSRRS